MSKYSIGDCVFIANDLHKGDGYNAYVNSDMVTYRGKMGVIKDKDYGHYKLIIDGEYVIWDWTEDMFDEEETEKYKKFTGCVYPDGRDREKHIKYMLTIKTEKEDGRTKEHVAFLSSNDEIMEIISGIQKYNKFVRITYQIDELKADRVETVVNTVCNICL